MNEPGDEARDPHLREALRHAPDAQLQARRNEKGRDFRPALFFPRFADQRLGIPKALIAGNHVPTRVCGHGMVNSLSNTR